MTKIYVHTLGCVLNKADSQRMIYLLKENGYEIVNNPEEANLIIINTCTVKTPAENEVFKLLKQFKDKKIILTGCLVQHRKDLVETVFKEYSIVGVYQIDKIVEAVEKTIKGERYVNLELKKIDKLRIPAIDQYPIKIIPIQEGCLWSCSYCATKFARAILQSFPPREIYNQIIDAVNKNLPIIYFTGTDLAAYGVDLGIDLADLLNGIKNINGLFFIRIGMANPGLLNKFIDKLLRAYEDPRIFKFFHIPVQSGSNRVLEDMGRRYTIEQFIELYEKIKEKYPYTSIATDVIVGYPTETEEDFNKTVKLLREYPFDVVNISKFWPRPNTEAWKLKPLYGWIVKKRSRIITKIFNEISKKNNEKWLDWEGWVIVESKGKNNSWIGRNFAYKQIIIKSDRNILGKFVRVKIKNITHVDLRADLIEIRDKIDIEDWTTNP